MYRTNQCCHVALADIRTCPAKPRIGSDSGDATPQVAGVTFRLVDAPARGAMVPDVVEVGMRSRRQNDAAHDDVLPHPRAARLRATNVSMSKGVEAPLHSPSTRAARSVASFVSCYSSNRSPARTTSLADP